MTGRGKVVLLLTNEEINMLQFNEKLMVKAKFNRGFKFSDGEFGVFSEPEFGDGELVDCLDGMECWVFCDVVVDDYLEHPQLFVYVPEYQFASTVLHEYVSM